MPDELDPEVFIAVMTNFATSYSDTLVNLSTEARNGSVEMRALADQLSLLGPLDE